MPEPAQLELAGQAMGFVALVLCVVAFSSREDRRLVSILILGNIAFAAQFALFGAWTAAGVTLVIILRLLLVRRMPGNAVAMTAVLLLTALAAAVTWSGPLDALPLAAGLIGTYAMFMLKGIPMRATMGLVSLCWIITNLLIGSIGALAAEAFILVTNLVTIVRLTRMAGKPQPN